MSARSAVPKASALPVASEFPKKGGLRLDHVLSVGMSNANMKKTATVPATGNKISFALAHKAPIVNVGISVLRKINNVVPKADIGINWQFFAAGQENEMVREWTGTVARALRDYPNLGSLNQVYQLHAVVDSIGNNPYGLARAGSANRGFYVYLLQVFEQAVRSAQVQGLSDSGFEKNWPAIVKAVDKDTRDLVLGALSDPDISNDVKENIFAYFDRVNKDVYNFFTQGSLAKDHTLAKKTSPLLTAFLYAFTAPDVIGGTKILRDMSLGL